MALSRGERRRLEAIDQHMCAADPGLAGQFDMFGRMWADQPRSPREQLPTRIGRLWTSLCEAMAVGAWAAPPVPDPTKADAGGGSTESRQAGRRPTA